MTTRAAFPRVGRFLALFLPLFAGTVLVADPNENGEAGAKELVRAVHANHDEKALALLESGVDPNARTRYGVFPLSVACRNGNARLVKALLKAGARPTSSLPGGETVLMTAARTGKVGPVSLLLEHGAKVGRAEPGRGQTALMWAAAEGHVEVVELLLDDGANPERQLDSGFTALLFAARDGHLEVVDLLLDHGVDVDYAIERGGSSRRAAPRGATALDLAVENGHYELAVRLLEAGADPDDQRSGLAPLHRLCHVRKPNRGDGEDGLPPPRGSGELTSLRFARILVETHGADVNLTLRTGSSRGSRFGTRDASPFLLASRRADLDYMKLLHELGADITVVNADGVTALLAAAGVGSRAPEEEAGTEDERLEALPWLLEFGLDIDAVSRQGQSAMHGAALKNAPGIVRWLDEQGADIAVWNREDRNGRTPLRISRGFRAGNFKPDTATEAALAEVMEEAGLDVPPPPKRDANAPKGYER